MRTELFINIYKKDELYLQRKISLKDKAMFLGSSPEADVTFPIQEMAPFHLLLVPPSDGQKSWRIFDEQSEQVIDLAEDVKNHTLQNWNFEFKVETGFTPEWETVPYDASGDTIILSFIKNSAIVRRQYVKLSGKTLIRWKGQEIALNRNELKSRTEPMTFESQVEDEKETLHVGLAKKSDLNYVASLSKSLRGGIAAAMLLVAVLISTTLSSHKAPDVAVAPEEQKIMVVKIPTSMPKKQQRQESQSASAQQVAPAAGAASAGPRSMASLGKAFKRFSKGLQGVALAPSQLSGGFAVGNLGSKLQGINSADGGGGGNGKLFNAASVGSTMGKGLMGRDGIKLLDDEMESSGGLKKEIIAQYIKSYLGQIVQCFERELSIQPDLTGKVVVNFTIGSKGKVSSALIQKSQFDNARFHGCITQKVHNWTFPVPDGGMNVVVNYPFLFRAQ